MARRAFRIVFSLLLTIGLLAVFLWNVDFHEVGRALAEARSGMLTAAVFLFGALFVVIVLTVIGRTIRRAFEQLQIDQD